MRMQVSIPATLLPNKAGIYISHMLLTLNEQCSGQEQAFFGSVMNTTPPAYLQLPKIVDHDKLNASSL